MYKNNDFLIDVLNKEGKSRKEISRTHRLCMGNLQLSMASAKKDAIDYDINNDNLFFREENCSKCYLCLLNNRSISLDENNYPSINKKKLGNYTFTVQDRLHFGAFISKMKEDRGISKWITVLFMLYGFDDVYRESSISDDYLDPSIKEIFKPSLPKSVYSKGILADVEINEKDFNIIFENKKSNTDNNWLKTAIGQISMYASSQIYNADTNDKYFVICYDGPRNEKKRISEIVLDYPFNKLKEVISDDNKHLSVLNSSQIYDQLLNDLEKNNVKKENLINLIKENIIQL